MTLSFCVLGIDPGLAALGYGIVQVDGRQMRAVDYGVLRTSRNEWVSKAADLTKRVGLMSDALAELLNRTHARHAALEEFGYYGRGVTSALQIANVMGMTRELLMQRGMLIDSYDARAVKRAITGRANATKAQVQKLVQVRLGMTKVPRPNHAADALAVATTYALDLLASRDERVSKMLESLPAQTVPKNLVLS